MRQPGTDPSHLERTVGSVCFRSQAKTTDIVVKVCVVRKFEMEDESSESVNAVAVVRSD